MSKTTEALKLAVVVLEDIIRVYKFETGTPVTALAAIREALDHSGDANEMVMAWSKVKPEAIKSDPMYQMGYAAAKAEPVKQEPVPYVDSTPHLHVGDSSFENWYQEHPKACGGDKQLARDAYAAGMGDPLVAPVERQWVDLTDDELKAALEVHQVGLSVRIGRIAIAAFKEKNK